ncbi:MBG domain-containing protein [Chitinophaga lutea]
MRNFSGSSSPLSLKRVFLFLFTCITSLAYGQAPVITSISPLRASPGQSLTITGSNFNPTTSNNIVRVGGVRAMVTGASSNTLMVTIPSGVATGPVSVTNLGTNLVAYSGQYFHLKQQRAKTTPLDGRDLFYQGNHVASSRIFNMDATDLNNDGKLDIVIGDMGNTNPTAPVATVGIMLNTTPAGSRTVSFTNQTATSNQYDSQGEISTADMDGDGTPEILMPVNHSATGASALYTLKAPDYLAYNPIPLGSNHDVISSHAADIDGDGRTDVVVAGYTSYKLLLLQNTSSGPGNFSFATPLELSCGNRPLKVKLLDMDNDGKPEIVALLGSSSIRLWRNTSTPGNISYATPIQVNMTAQMVDMDAGDVDGDGKPDLVFSFGSAASFLATIFRNTSTPGNIGFIEHIVAGTPSPNANIALGDLNGDGLPELIVGASPSSAPRAYVMENASGAGAPAFRAGQVNLMNPDAAIGGIVSGDFNGDGRNDIIAGQIQNRYCHIYQGTAVPAPTNQATGLTATPADYSATLNWANGDGERRVVFVRSGTGGAPPVIDLTKYSANTVFGAGSPSGASYCVYDGTGTSVNVTGLTSNSTYTATVLEYNEEGIPNNARYLTTATPGANIIPFQTLVVNNLPCDIVTAQANSANGICVGCAVSTPGLAIDTDSTTASKLNLTVLTAGAYAEQTLIFPGLAPAGDTITLRMKVHGVPAANALTAITVGSNNYASPNNDWLALNANDPRLKVEIDPLNNTSMRIKLVLLSPYDRITIRLNGGTSLGLSALEIFYAIRTVPTPVVTGGQVCVGTPFTFSANAIPNCVIDWFDAPGGALLFTGNDYNVGGVNLTHTLYAQARRTSNNCRSTDLTPATVTVLSKPLISTQPVSTSISAGQPAGFTVAATGAGPLIYQWQADAGSGYVTINDGAMYSGAGTTNLQITAATTALNGVNYRCMVVGACVPAAFTNPATLTVNPLTQTLSIPGITNGATVNKIYGDAPFSAAATASSSLTPVYSSSAPSVAAISATGDITPLTAGATTITVSQPGDAIYSAAPPISFTVSVSPRALAIDADALMKVYGQADPALTCTATGLINGDVLTGALTRVSGENTGAYAILQGTLAAGPNYIITYASQNLVITKAPLTVTMDAQSKTYGEPDPSFTFTANGFTNGDAPTILTGAASRAAGEAAGSYPLTIGTLDAGGNYDINFTGNTFTIDKATLTVNADARSKTYGSADPALTYTATGFTNGDASTVLTGSPARATGETAGAYPVSIGTLATNANYTIAFTGNTFTISKATLTVNADAKSKTYGAAEPSLTYTATGFTNGDAPTVLTGSPARTAGETAGAYPISIGTLATNANYAIAFTGNTFTINKATLTVNADAKSKTYGAADPALTYTATGLTNGDATTVLTGSLTRTAGQAAGAYPISIGTLNAGANYTINFTGNTLTINKAMLTIATEAKSKTYGAADPALTYTAAGFANGETIAVLTGALSRTPGENAGTYNIQQGTLAAGNNYAVQFTGAAFTIAKAPQAITWQQALTFGCNGSAPVQLTAVSSSGLPVSYSISNTGVATINGNTLTPGEGGHAIVTAAQAGDANYLPATAVPQHVDVQLTGVVRQQWSDVLTFDNSSMRFVQWQWYKNGTAVQGATRQYFSESGALNGTYYVIATDDKGQAVQSCPLAFTGSGTASRGIRVSQNPVNRGAMVTVTCNYPDASLANATLQITDVTGRVVHTQNAVQATQQLRMPTTQGLYIITLLMRDGQKASVNVLVN